MLCGTGIQWTLENYEAKLKQVHSKKIKNLLIKDTTK